MTTATPTKIPLPPKALALRLASACFLYPDEAWREPLRELLEAARREKAVPAPGLGALRRAFEETPLEALQTEHFRLFGPAPACPLDLAHHLTKDPYGQAKRIADLAGFYKAFGVETEGRADSLPAALEFSALLEIKAARAEERGWKQRRRICRDAASKLSGEILSKALAAFARKLHGAGAHEFYLQAAALSRSILGGTL